MVRIDHKLGGKRFWKMYTTYLKSEVWKTKRKRVLERDEYTCQKCGEKDRRKLQVHHKSYTRLFKESTSDLVTLCKRCHKRWHERDKIKKQKRRQKR